MELGIGLQRPNLLLPQARMVLGCPLSLPWCARAWKFRVWVEGNEVGSPFHQKNPFLCCLRVLAPQALARRCPGASPLTSGASRRWLGAVQALAPVFGRLQALARRWAGAGQTSFWKTAIATSSTVGLS